MRPQSPVNSPPCALTGLDVGVCPLASHGDMVVPLSEDTALGAETAFQQTTKSPQMPQRNFPGSRNSRKEPSLDVQSPSLWCYVTVMWTG